MLPSPYVIALANKGWEKSLQRESSISTRINIVEGKVVYKAVADVFGLKVRSISL